MQRHPEDSTAPLTDGPKLSKSPSPGRRLVAATAGVSPATVSAGGLSPSPPKRPPHHLSPIASGRDALTSRSMNNINTHASEPSLRPKELLSPSAARNQLVSKSSTDMRGGGAGFPGRGAAFPAPGAHAVRVTDHDDEADAAEDERVVLGTDLGGHLRLVGIEAPPDPPKPNVAFAASPGGGGSSSGKHRSSNDSAGSGEGAARGGSAAGGRHFFDVLATAKMAAATQSMDGGGNGRAGRLSTSSGTGLLPPLGGALDRRKSRSFNNMLPDIPGAGGAGGTGGTGGAAGGLTRRMSRRDSYDQREDAAMTVIRRMEERRQRQQVVPAEADVKVVLGKWRKTAVDSQRLLHASDRDKWKGFVSKTGEEALNERDDDGWHSS